MTSRAVRRRRPLYSLVHKFMLRTGRGALRPLWALVHQAAIRALALYLTRGEPGAAAYVVGSFAAREPVYGLSDLDMMIVIPGDASRPGEARRRILRRLARLSNAAPLLAETMFDIGVVEDGDLRAVVTATPFTYGLDRTDRSQPAEAAAYLGPLGRYTAPSERPGPHPPLANWHSVRGPERRPPVPDPDAQRKRIGSWLDLQAWWRYACAACADPGRPRTAHLCVKLVTEPLRGWLWLTRGEHIVSRTEVVDRGMVLLPGERDMLLRTRSLERSLIHDPQPPLANAMTGLVRFSSRIAARLVGDAAMAGATNVRLVGAPDSGPMPLLDWRAMVAPGLPGEAFVIVGDDPADPAAVGAAARAARPGEYAVIRRDLLHVMPTSDVHAGMFRAIQCPATDPVSFALAAGDGSAAFPNLPGWSAEDVSRRAVAEHRAWLQARVPTQRSFLLLEGVPTEMIELARLFTAARAALFCESVAFGEPELLLTVDAVVDRLADRGAGSAAEEAYGAYLTWRRSGEHTSVDIDALRQSVLFLPSYTPLHQEFTR
jgi:predicted nucleotidyltransferase